MSSPLSHSSTHLGATGETPLVTGAALEPVPELDWEQVQAQLLEQPGCRQLLFRSVDAEHELVQAALRVSWPAGSSLAVMHLPLVPPVAEITQVSVELAATTNARLRITDQQPYGIRVEASLPAAPKDPIEDFLLLVVVAKRSD